MFYNSDSLDCELCVEMKPSLKMKFFTCKNIAIKLYSYFTNEKDRNKYFYSISKPLERTKHILDLKDRTLRRWISENNTEAKKEHMKTGRPNTFDSFDKDLIGRSIVQMINDKLYVTIRTLKSFLAKNHDFNISKVSLWRLVRSLGFTFKKTKTSKEFICESKPMVALRGKYLRKLKELRESNVDIFYLDESYINAHHTCEKEWQSADGRHQRIIPSGKGKRVVIAHCGGYNTGLLENAGLMFESKSKDDNGDYHKDMDGTVFHNWIRNSVVPVLPKNSCVVMDNASYHNVINPEDKVPTKSTNKGPMKAWLDKYNIDHTAAKTKQDLLQLVNASEQSKVDCFRIDKYLEERGHVPLRLPPYHPQLNPIELIWAEMKKKVAEENTTFKLKDVKRHTTEALANISKTYWQKCEDHVKRIEKSYWENDGLNLPMQPRVVIDPMDTSDSE